MTAMTRTIPLRCCIRHQAMGVPSTSVNDILVTQGQVVKNMLSNVSVALAT